MLLGLALAGCGGGSTQGTTTTQAARRDPGAALRALLVAARAGDESKVRSLLVPGSPASLASELVDGLGSYPRKTPVVLSVQIDPDFAVAAIAGPRVGEGMREHGAYAVALKAVGNRYRAVVVSPVRIRPLGPDPGSTQGRVTQVAAEFSAPKPIVQAGLWVDGIAIPAEPNGPPRRFTAYGTTWKLKPGWHNVVAFAEAGGSGTATAWTFRVR